MVAANFNRNDYLNTKLKVKRLENRKCAELNKFTGFEDLEDGIRIAGLVPGREKSLIEMVYELKQQVELQADEAVKAAIQPMQDEKLEMQQMLDRANLQIEELRSENARIQSESIVAVAKMRQELQLQNETTLQEHQHSQCRQFEKQMQEQDELHDKIVIKLNAKYDKLNGLYKRLASMQIAPTKNSSAIDHSILQALVEKHHQCREALDNEIEQREKALESLHRHEQMQVQVKLQMQTLRDETLQLRDQVSQFKAKHIQSQADATHYSSLYNNLLQAFTTQQKTYLTQLSKLS